MRAVYSALLYTKIMFAELTKVPAKLDCLKSSDVLALESIDYSTFHLLALIILICAILHTLFIHKVHDLARKLEKKQAPNHSGRRYVRSLGVHFLYFISEVEIVFAFWVIPLFAVISIYYGPLLALEYINTRDYTETLFVVIILSISSTRPIIQLAQKIIQFFAHKFGGSLSAWWFTLLTVCPLLGSFITEPGAMAIGAYLLSRQFYHYKPSSKLAYATLALLFTNVSVGGVLTNFASPAVLILSHAWDWSNLYIFLTFGWKAAIGIVISNAVYWVIFRKEFAQLNSRQHATSEHFIPPQEEAGSSPAWVTAVHLVFMAFIVLTAEYPAIFIAGYLFFAGFHQATRHHQDSLKLTRPLLVGLFLAGLVIHGGLQRWWVDWLLTDLNPLQVLGMSMGLTAFNDNTAIAYLATLIQDFGEANKYALFSGVICGGGLTVIANAPNPAGFVILSEHFPLRRISSGSLFIAALLPAVIFYIIYFFLGPLFFN
jgi:hypothetical protein